MVVRWTRPRRALEATPAGGPESMGAHWEIQVPGPLTGEAPKAVEEAQARKAPGKKVQKGKTGQTGGMMTFDEGDDEDDVF